MITSLRLEHDVNRKLIDEITTALLSDPHDTTAANPYYSFFNSHNASLWTIDMNTHIASPLQIDVVYTYVNPSAPSFARHALERNLNAIELKRFRDWEELRYSLRALKAYALDSEALRQYQNQYAEDVELLKSLGFRVMQNTPTKDNSSKIESTYSLIRRIYLVLSDVDQIPDWLNVEEFAMLRVVTHAELFTRDNESFILPTLNSNAIESTLHRIANLSTFFWYFNDDMLLGRKLSLFDLFRPVTLELQELYSTHLEHNKMNEDARASNILSRELQEQFYHNTCTHHPRSVIFMEPVYSVDDTISTTKEFVYLEEVTAKEETVSNKPAVIENSNSSNTSLHSQGVFSVIIRCIKSILFIQSPIDESLHWRDNLDMVNSRLIRNKFTHANFTGAYAHKPLLIYKEMYRLLTEETRIGFHEEINALRHTYSRVQSQTSPVHLYTPYVQMYQQLINKILSKYNNISRKSEQETQIYEVYEKEEELEYIMSGVRETFLDAITNVYRVNKAKQMELFPTPKLTMNDQWSMMWLTNPLSNWRQLVMRQIGNTINNKVCYAVLHFTSALFYKNKSMQSAEVIEKRKWNMRVKDYAVEDVDSQEYWFVMLDSEVKLLLSLTKAVDIAQRGNCALFVTINDDLPSTAAIRTQTWHLHFDNGNTTRLNVSTLVHFLLHFCVGKVPSAPWEKENEYAAKLYTKYRNN